MNKAWVSLILSFFIIDGASASSWIHTKLNFKYSPKSICGGRDDRTASFDLRIGRGLKNRQGRAPCSVTLVSKSCVISAGHCHDYLRLIEFNTPLSNGDGLVHADERDRYDVDRTTLVYKDGGMGNDWAVFKIKPNKITGKRAGEVYGWLPITGRSLRDGDRVSIKGYGAARNPELHFAQKKHKGRMTSASGASISYAVDTTGGNSGSSVVSVRTGEIVGVHAFGGCDSFGYNSGTSITDNRRFRAAVKQCIRSDK